ncbi:hypothetical protein GF402_07215 [Candidatus Fermentibacteria bacterium]|nr:hypothetical protein [Candidatus Fermentibacteria bacterium]
MDKSHLRARTRAVLSRGAILHCAAVKLGDVGFIFPALSGGGKSTLAAKMYAEGLEVLAEDFLTICIGTDGTTRLLPIDPDRRCKLTALVLLEKSIDPYIIRAHPKYACFRIIRDKLIMAYGALPPEERGTLREGVRTILDVVTCFIMGLNTRTKVSPLLYEIAKSE